MGDGTAKQPGLPAGAPKAVTDMVGCTGDSISWKPGDKIDWLDDPAPTITIADISQGPSGDVTVTGQTLGGYGPSVSATLSVSGGNLSVQLSGLTSVVGADAANSWVADLNHWLASHNKRLDVLKYDKKTKAVTFTKVAVPAATQTVPPRSDAPKEGVKAGSGALLEGLAAGEALELAPAGAASGADAPRFQGASRAQTADAVGAQTGDTVPGAMGYSRLDQRDDPWGYAERHPLLDKEAAHRVFTEPAEEGHLGGPAGKGVEGSSRTQTSEEIKQTGTPPIQEPQLPVILTDDEPVQQSTGSKNRNVIIGAGAGLLVLGGLLGGIFASVGNGPSTKTGGSQTPSAAKLPATGASSGGAPTVLGGLLCVTSQAPTPSGPTSPGSSSQGATSQGATSQGPAAYVEIKVSTQPNVNGVWVIRLDTVSATGTNVNGSTGTMVNGSGTFTIPVAQLPARYDSVSWVDPQSQIIDGGPFNSRFPLILTSPNVPCTTVSNTTR